MKVQKSKFSEILFQCNDIEKTRNFYEALGFDPDSLGLEPDKPQEPFLVEKGDYATSAEVLMIIACEDVLEMAESLKGSGVAVIEPPAFKLYGGMQMIIADPDGRHIVLAQSAKKNRAYVDEYIASMSGKKQL